MIPGTSIAIRCIPSQTASTYESASFPSNPRSSRSATPTSILMAPLATPERPSTPEVDVAATSPLYWHLSISPPFYEPRWGDPARGTALSCDTYSEIRHDGPLRLTNEVTYYRVLQHFHQWRNASDICPWALACDPRSQEVVKYGLMHRFLNSLGPPPPGWVCPPLIAANLRRRRRRRRHRRHKPRWHHQSQGKAQNRNWDVSDLHKQAGPSAEAGLVGETGHVAEFGLLEETNIPVTTKPEASSPPLGQAKKWPKRGKRGGGRSGKKNKTFKATEGKLEPIVNGSCGSSWAAISKDCFEAC